MYTISTMVYDIQYMYDDIRYKMMIIRSMMIDVYTHTTYDDTIHPHDVHLLKYIVYNDASHRYTHHTTHYTYDDVRSMSDHPSHISHQWTSSTSNDTPYMYTMIDVLIVRGEGGEKRREGTVRYE